MRRQVLQRSALRHLGRTGQRQRQLDRRRVGTVLQAQLDADGSQPVIVRRAPGKARLLSRAPPGHAWAGRLREASGRGLVRDGGERPGLRTDASLNRQRAADGQVALRLPASGIQGAERRGVPVQRQHGFAAATGHVDHQVRPGRDRQRRLVRTQEHRRDPGVGRRRDPALDDRGRGWRARGQPRQGPPQQPASSLRPGDHGSSPQRNQQPATEGAPVARRQARTRRRHTEPGRLRRGPGQVRAPQRRAFLRRLCRLVRQDRERAVAQAAVRLQPPVGAGFGRRDHPAHTAPRQDARRQHSQAQQQQPGPRRQHRRHVQQHQDDIGAKRTQRRPRSWPNLLPPKRRPRQPALPREGPQPGRRAAGQRSAHPSQSGALSPSHKASTGWRARITDQRQPSTMTWAASGREL